MSAYTVRSRDFVCPLCKAGIGRDCVNGQGVRMIVVHAPRSILAKTA